MANVNFKTTVENASIAYVGFTCVRDGVNNQWRFKIGETRKNTPCPRLQHLRNDVPTFQIRGCVAMTDPHNTFSRVAESYARDRLINFFDDIAVDGNDYFTFTATDYAESEARMAIFAKVALMAYTEICDLLKVPHEVFDADALVRCNKKAVRVGE